jgi:predicted Zn-dependent protease
MQQNIWQQITQSLFNELKEGEMLSLSLSAEDSLFVRVNQAKVRQSSEVSQGVAEISLYKGQKNLKVLVPISFQKERDLTVCWNALKTCQQNIDDLPEDPFIQLPVKHEPIHQKVSEKVDRYDLVGRVLNNVQGHDFVGIFMAGELIRANQNSCGLDQWFETSNFAVDFSFYTKNQQAIKGLYGGQEWRDDEFEAHIKKKLHMLGHLNTPPKTIEKNKYRCYFSPSAVATLLSSLSWMGIISREGYERGQCALKMLVDKQSQLSSMLTLRENFSSGGMPRFNDVGEISEEIIPLIEMGEYKNLLCCSRSAKEYGVPSNFANGSESMRSPEILAGHIPSDQELEALGTGVYVSDLHYLNWSNVQKGSITGMTRFGCFWVENGQIVAPVKDMRFDETLYHFWGEGLEGFTNKSEVFSKTGTYYQRELGTLKAPGMIVNEFSFVL